MNVLEKTSLLEEISAFFQIIAPSARLEILLAIGTGETCVCHLEATLGYRQAYISQHLMALRNAEIIESRREGRFIYHRLKNPALLDLIEQAVALSGQTELNLPVIDAPCGCPKCV